MTLPDGELITLPDTMVEAVPAAAPVLVGAAVLDAPLAHVA